MRWPWQRRKPSAEIEQARRRLEEIRRDDDAVNNLTRRATRILRENNLAPDIMRALGVRR